MNLEEYFKMLHQMAADDHQRQLNYRKSKSQRRPSPADIPDRGEFDID